MGNTKRGKSGYYGVYWHELGQKWNAQIRDNKKIKYLGLFEDKEAAARAYDKEAIKLKKKLLNFGGVK